MPNTCPPPNNDTDVVVNNRGYGQRTTKAAARPPPAHFIPYHISVPWWPNVITPTGTRYLLFRTRFDNGTTTIIIVNSVITFSVVFGLVGWARIVRRLAFPLRQRRRRCRRRACNVRTSIARFGNLWIRRLPTNTCRQSRRPLVGRRCAHGMFAFRSPQPNGRSESRGSRDTTDRAHGWVLGTGNGLGKIRAIQEGCSLQNCRLELKTPNFC